MAVTIDANVLVYAQDSASASHDRARQALEAELATGEPVYLFMPVVLAFLRVSTQPGLFARPLSLRRAYENIAQLLALPHVTLGLPTDRFLHELVEVAEPRNAIGRLVHDAEIVTLMKEHSVERILTADRDFLRFDGIEVTLLAR